jgi:amino acid transporter
MNHSSAEPVAALDLRPDQLTVLKLVYLVLAAAAPLAGVVACVPLVISGVGIGAPGMYFAMGVILACFAAGYATMSQSVTRPGAFYAYITLGMGTYAGMASAAIAAMAYVLCYIGTVAITSVFAFTIVADQTGVHVNWLICAVLLMALVTLVARRGVEVSARILMVVFTFEMAIVLVLDLVILVRAGVGAFSLSSFAPTNVVHGSSGLAFAFAAVSFVGFEATAIYSREAKDPDRTVPKATYAAVTLASVFYLLAAWALVAGNGGTAASVLTGTQDEHDGGVDGEDVWA